MNTHMAWRWNTTHELPKSRSACTDDADRTITSPTTTSALTSIASNTNSGVDRDCDRAPAFRACGDAGRRRVRTRSATAGTGILSPQLADRPGEVVAPFRVRAVPVERRATR